MRRFIMSMLLVLGLGIALPAWAAEYELPQNKWEIGPEVYYVQYKEPNVSVEFKGPMYGLAASFTHHNPAHFMLKADGRSAWGLVDYSGSGKINNIEDWTLEGRLAAGYDISLAESQWITPFAGVGYRYLNDNSSGRTSSTGAVGYERESNYLYSPIGLEFSTKLNNGWQIGLNAEYDFFWIGRQKSHLENVAASLNTVTNEQNHGYGVRGGIQFQKLGERFDVIFEPYARWWTIKNSKRSNVTYSGVLIGYAYEPQNETLEVGGKIAVRF